MNTNTNLIDTLPNFHGNFNNWLDTFFHLACMIQNNYDENWNNDSVSQVKITQDIAGHSGLMELAKDWTIQFEEIHKSHNWEELDFYETIEAFFNSKNTL